MFAHFSMGIGPTAFLHTLIARFGARSASAAGAAGGAWLTTGYVRSFGLFLVALILAARPAWARLRRSDAADSGGPAAVAAVLIVLAGACAENLVLSQHAAQFAFDRFKLALPLGLIVLVALTGWDGHRRMAMALLLSVASLAGIAGWYAALRADSGWQAVYARNLALRSRIDAMVDRRCALFASDGPVRAQSNLWLMRGIHEMVSPGHFSEHGRDCACLRRSLPARHAVPDRFNRLFWCRHGDRFGPGRHRHALIGSQRAGRPAQLSCHGVSGWSPPPGSRHAPARRPA